METSAPNDLDSPSASAATPHMKFREGCVLNNLSAAEQELLFDWLELHPPKTVLEMISAPPPAGFGLKTHLKSLRRFHHRARAVFHKELTAAPLEVVGEPGSDVAADQLTVAVLRQFAVEMATVQQRNPAHFATVSRWALRLQQNAQRERELKIAEDRLALTKLRVETERSKAELEKTKFEFNASRAALSCLTELDEIVEKHPGDSEDKIWAARERLFPPRSDLIENPNLQAVNNTPSASATPPDRGFVRGAQSAAQTQAP